MSQVIVRGPDVMKPPICVSDDAHTIEFRDRFGDLMALMVRVLSEDGWGLITKDDPDWETALIHYGFKQPDKSFTDVIGRPP